ncbi:small nuclear ribonucleoprotein [Candidatus Woesearchaeota archaeon]|jgi:small nuclear ribonucleoprotein (snRNP)-like protein|nr:small nuclear ribonucleoprotein [Candidatus Woesearchaeota archaeon]|tara:strand:- start:702 stop:905 length:204 start_codon:yes stop_codon:yes gene_type:complete
MERPLDALSKSKGTEIKVLLKNDKEVKGKLVAYDIHTNLALENAVMNGNEHKNLFIRGDMVVYISMS